MSVEATAFGIPILIGIALAFVPWKWSLSAFAILVVMAILGATGASPGAIPAPVFWLFFLVFAAPLVLLGCIGRMIRRKLLPSVLGAREGGQGA